MIRFCKPGSCRKDAADREGGIVKGIKQNWLPLTLGLIVLITIITRTIFSYGLSAGNGFALSGTSATEHQHTIVSILTGTFGLSDPSLNYPYGGTLMQPPFVDMILAGFAWIPTVMGVSAQTAAAGALAFSGPIAAAITVILIYILGKEMFDRNTGILSAFLFAVLPLPVVMSVFSDGTTMGILLMFFVMATLLMFRAMKALNSSEVRGIKAAFAPGVMKYTVGAGLMFAVIALSWNGFGMIVTLLVFMMAAQAVVSRLNHRDFGATFGAYATMILISVIIPLPYYFGAGLFTYVYTGPLLISAISVAVVALFYYVRRKSTFKAFLVPILAVVAAFVILYFAAPQLFSDVVSGNAMYESSLLADLLKPQNVQISKMASFYGWATVWMPFVMITYLFYRLDKNNPSETHIMTALWMLGVFILSWLSKDNAIMAGAMYSVAAASALVLLYRYVGMTDYFKAIKGGGWKAMLKKFLRPEPFISLICVAFLVVAPNAVLLADATTSSNRDGNVSGGYLGGINYFVDTDKDNPMNILWDDYYGETKEGALATWFENSSKAVDRGGFVSVTSDSGQGATAVSNILLSKGSAGAISAMIIRMVLAEGIDKYAGLMDAGLVAELKEIINNPSKTKSDVLKNQEAFSGIDSDITEENAIYLAASDLLTSELNETEIHKIYKGVRDLSNGAIAYIAISGDMLPMFQNDGTLFSAIAYLNNYALDSNGAVPKYYEYGYILNYTDAIFETFIWQALIGLNNETGINYYAAVSLALSDGTLAASPGLGLTGFEVDYWKVKYNPNEDAGISDSGWVYMDGYEAVEKQKTEGGLINYLSSMIVLKVSDFDEANVESGTVTSNGVPFAGAKVAVFEKDPNDIWVQRSTAFTDEDGKYSVVVPSGTDYQIRVYVATEKTVGGTYLTYNTGPNFDFDFDLSVLYGSVEGEIEGLVVEAVGKYSGTELSATVDSLGEYTISGLVPDKYDVSLKLNGKTIDTTTITVYPGNNFGVDFDLSSTLKVTVKDMYGAPMDAVKVAVENKYDGTIIIGETNENGLVEFKVLPSNKDIENSGLYIVYAKDLVGTSSDVKVSGKSATTSLTVFGTETEIGSNITVMAPGYSSYGQDKVLLPDIGDAVYTLVYENGEVRTTEDLSVLLGNIVDFNAELKSKSDTPIQGKITFFGENGVTFTYTSDEDGIVSAKLLPGDYTVLAVGKNGTCVIDEVNVPATPEVDATVFKTDNGRTVKATFTFDSRTDGTKGVPFTKVTFVVEIDEIEYTIYGTTDSSGVASVSAPKSAKVKVSIDDGTIGELTWDAKEKNVGTGTSTTFSVSRSDVNNPEINLKDTWLWASTSDIDKNPSYEAEDDVVEITPGTYYCIVKNSSGLYTYSKVKVYIGHNVLFHDPETVVEDLSLVTVTEPGDSKVSVEIHPDSEDAEYYKVRFVADDETILYLMTDGDYLFKAVKDDDISYKLIKVFSSDQDVDLTPNFEKKATLKGYLGVDGDGIAKIDIGGVELFTKVKKGIYSVDLPEIADKAEFNVTLTYKPTGSEYTYEYVGTFDVEDILDYTGEEVQVITTNAYLKGDGTIVAATDKLEITTGTVTITGNKFEFPLTVTPATGSEGKKTYAVKAVGPWQLDKAYVIEVENDTAETKTISGIFSPSNVSDRDSKMKVSIVNLEGKTEATGEITGIYMPSGASEEKLTVSVSVDDGAAPDWITDNEYMYAITVRNHYNGGVGVKLSVSGITGDWIYVITDEDGRVMVTSNEQLTLAGNTRTVLYVKLMNVNGGLEDVPDITVNVAEVGGTFTVDGTPVTLEPKEIELGSSLSIEGKNVHKTGNAMQPLFWALAVLSIIMIVLIVWLGSKRGVFSRRR